jgi:hypothetical protein
MTVVTTDPPVHLPHTDLEMPYAMTLKGLAVAEHDRGVAYSAELVHPDHGVVGLISNKGCGDDTRFDAYNDATFSVEDLKRFHRRCRQDGEVMNPEALHDLLDELVDEDETSDQVEEARRAGLFLVRSYLPRTKGWPSSRGTPRICTQIVRSRSARQALADKLDTAGGHGIYGPDAMWQMFNGVQWTALLGEHPLTPEQITARVSRARVFVVRSLDSEPFGEGMFIHGNPAGRFVLTGDRSRTLNRNAWCRCGRPRQRNLRFELWNRLVLEECGVVHAAKNCRRLVRVD